PSMHDVTATDCCFSTPRMIMQKCMALTTTATPRGCTASCRASAISTVSRSCTCSRRAYMLTRGGILDSPTTLPAGRYATGALPSPARMARTWSLISDMGLPPGHGRRRRARHLQAGGDLGDRAGAADRLARRRVVPGAPAMGLAQALEVRALPGLLEGLHDR